nr:hypothetical protein [Tanacetum cinerariifolium]
MFKLYGNMVDVYLAFKRTKLNTRFSFVRFINVVNVEFFEKKLNEILIGDVKLIINRAKFVKVEGRGVPVFIDPVNKSAPSSNYVEAKGMKNGTVIEDTLVDDSKQVVDTEFAFKESSDVSSPIDLDDERSRTAHSLSDASRVAESVFLQILVNDAEDINGLSAEHGDKEYCVPDPNSPMNQANDNVQDQGDAELDDLLASFQKLSQSVIDTSYRKNNKGIQEFKLDSVDGLLVVDSNFLCAIGTWVGVSCKIGFMNIYGPQCPSQKKVLWNSIESVINSTSAAWILFRDFNVVRLSDERSGTIFDANEVNVFNDFISRVGLFDFQLGGCRFTRIDKSGYKLSKLDRFLVTYNFFNCWSDASVKVLASSFSDHCLLLLSVGILNFGPKAFKFFDKWIGDDLKQKSRVKWAIEGGENTSYFFVLRNRFAKFSIKGIHVSGIWYDNPVLIKEAAMKHFALRFKERTEARPKFSSSLFRRLSPEDDSFLDSSFSVDEVKEAVWSFSGSKALGPDGFNFSFIKAYWEVIRLAKIKAHKLLLFKVDFKKAFDSVNWGFLQDVVIQMGFGAKWRRWIDSCLSSSSISVLINGSPSKEFKMERGLHQGDPLSPFLFLLVAEALQVAVVEACNRGIYKGVHLAEDGIGVSMEEVEAVASSLCCIHDSIPFTYLGLPVGKKCTTVTVGVSLPIYFLSLFKAPLKVINLMESVRSRFLGFQREPEGLLGKWKWRFVSKENALWRKVTKAFFGADGDLNLHPSSIGGNGRRTYFWLNLWCSNGVRLMDLFPRLYALGTVQECKVCDRWCESDGAWGEIWWSWSRDASGSFKVKACCDVIQEKALADCSLGLHHLWNSWIPRKVNICIWRASINSALPIWRKVWSWWKLDSPSLFPSFSIADIALGRVGIRGHRVLDKITHGIFQCALWATSKWRNKVVMASMDSVAKVKNAKLAHMVYMSSLTGLICSVVAGGTATGGDNGSGDGDFDGGSDGEGDLDLLRDEDGKSDGNGEDDDDKSGSGGEDDDEF